ncbi:hypothetical protein [Kribbella alba]
MASYCRVLKVVGGNGLVDELSLWPVVEEGEYRDGYLRADSPVQS